MDKVKKPAAQAARKKLELDQPMGLPKKDTSGKKNPPLTETVLGFKQTYPAKVIITRVGLCACVSCPLAAIAVLWCSISWLGSIHLRVPEQESSLCPPHPDARFILSLKAVLHIL